MSNSIARPALVLGLLSCIGPFAIDMYLPAMPAIGTDLSATVQDMQGTITAYFVAFGLAQLVYGPWADQAGRKTPLYAGIAIFCLGTLLCMMAPSGAMLSAGRFVQGLGGAALMVVPRAIIRDMSTGNEATRLMAAMMLVFSVSPMLAPLAGSGLLLVTGWRGIFAALLVAAMFSVALLRFGQPETLPPALRQRFHAADTLRAAKRLLTDRGFVALTFLGAFGMASFFVFLASAAYVYTESFGLSPTGFSLAFAVNAISFIGASQAAGPLGLRFGAMRVMRVATLGFAVFTVGLAALAVTQGVGLYTCIIGLALGNACLGMVIPTTMVMALDDHGDIAGLASSLGGTLQMLTGGVIVAAMGPFFSADPAPMIVVIASCAVVALLLSRLTRAPQPKAAAAS
ncbi:MAG: Bcr/CflA family drug resistance efflux transporter [Rhodobacterales bacterium RIFCSPHIGHO2_02_FULL_62_130]|nr:MAG: Bcr/CflA family drug resistance efflux transporter [Rhodobacterales bacterium RIFCSPHIGHO2_02_FULL_62_130]OHC53832.1 MAG: Bcr/CflA family drug resistance efflux transporter [Rhodobacterales bacterium RIFCSPHIGHO2_12_FULL_62_75]HCZ00200.1 Bcr/CflA family drug resistance efflux transporter [Rhodobacter sp.]